MGFELDTNGPLCLDTLNSLCDWMRKRGVMALKVAEIAITLHSMQEPVEQKPEEPLTPEQIRARARKEREANYYAASDPK
jgi:hypothetical protein